MLFYYHYNLIHFYRLKKALPRHGNIPAMSMNYTLISYSKPDCSDGGVTLFLAGADHRCCETKRRTRQNNLPSATVSLQVVISLCRRKETAALKIKVAVSYAHENMSALRRLFFFCRRPAD